MELFDRAIYKEARTHEVIVAYPISDVPQPQRDLQNEVIQNRRQYKRHVNFSKALNHVKRGRRIRRKCWKDQFVVKVDSCGFSTVRGNKYGFRENKPMNITPILQLVSEYTLAPYIPTMDDLFAEDWEWYEDDEPIVRTEYV